MNYVNQKIRDSAKGRDCTMNSHMCNYDPESTVWCHSNYLEHGKGVGLKSHDCYGFYGCYGCHVWYDGGYLAEDRPDCHSVRRESYQRAHDKSILILVMEGILK